MNFKNQLKVFYNQLGGEVDYEKVSSSYPNKLIINQDDYNEMKKIVNMVLNTDTIESMSINELNALKNKLLDIKNKNKIIDQQNYQYANLNVKKNIKNAINWTVPTIADEFNLTKTDRKKDTSSIS